MWLSKQGWSSSSLLLSLLLLAILTTSSLVVAHRRAINGRGSCDDDYGSSLSALPLPDPTISWSFKHYLDCTHRSVWIELVNPTPNQEFYIGVGIPPQERFDTVRADALIIGPGLPAITDDDVWDLIPTEVQNDPIWTKGNTIGAYFHRSPTDQSTCNHLGTVMARHSTIVDGRCDFYEPYGRTHSWRVLDADHNLLPEAGATYHAVVFLQENTSAKLGIAMGTWVENFIRRYDLDTPSCTRDMNDFSEKSGTQEDSFPVVTCLVVDDDDDDAKEGSVIENIELPPQDTGEGEIVDGSDTPPPPGSLAGEGIVLPLEASVCDKGQMCNDDDVESGNCVIAGVKYQPPTTGSCGGQRCPAAVQVWESINHKMHVGMMDLTYTGNVDIDFVRGMIPHHIGAVDMCLGLLEDLTCTSFDDGYGMEGVVHLCNHIQLEQELEVGGMRAWLERHNLTEVEPCGEIATTRQHNHHDGSSMTTMSNNNMMIMTESCGNVDASSSQKLLDVNHKMHDLMAIDYSCHHEVDFYRMMLPHHAAAVEMCDVLVESSQDDYLLALCDNITLTQRAEISWMYDWLQARDYPATASCRSNDECSEVLPHDEMEGRSSSPLFCEDTLSTSSFCHGITGNIQDGYCRCDEETFTNNNFSCNQATSVDGFGVFVTNEHCKRTCGLCPSDDRPLWLLRCDDTSMDDKNHHHGNMHSTEGDPMGGSITPDTDVSGSFVHSSYLCSVMLLGIGLLLGLY